MLGEVFVTGMGIVSGLGLGVDETLNSLLLSKSGIGKIKHLDTINDIPCSEVDFTDSEMKKLLHLDEDSIVPRTALMGILAVKEVLDSAQFPLDGNYKVAFINGTTVGGMEKSELYYIDFLQNDSRNKYIEAHDCGSLTEKIADYFGGFSYVSTPSTACSSAANAVILGMNLIEAGIVDAAIVGGSECITKFHLNGFKSLMILDSTPCKPFDQNRAGLNLGEGAAFLLLESSELVSSRKSKPLARIKGYGNACDAYHQTASSPEGKGATLAMQAALKMSGLNNYDINYINAHGTGTLNNDESEGNAIINIFGKNPPPVSSTKSLTGHTTSASGGVEAVISILAINHDFIPANANFKTQMEALTFAPVKEVIQNIEVKNVLSNSFGFGGNNTSLIFSKVY
jgi:3-oxoacyl-[acyl-carrier-protein] synthase II